MSNDYLELSYRSIQCFADDGKLLLEELDSLLSVALRDGVVDKNEKRVLENIFDRLTTRELTKEMQDRIEKIKQEYF